MGGALKKDNIMSYSDPLKIIDHIPKDFDMKIRHRKQRLRPHPPRPASIPTQKAQPETAEPFSCERPGRVWTLIAFFGALAIIAGALITGAWDDAH